MPARTRQALMDGKQVLCLEFDRIKLLMSMELWIDANRLCLSIRAIPPFGLSAWQTFGEEHSRAGRLQIRFKLELETSGDEVRF